MILLRNIRAGGRALLLLSALVGATQADAREPRRVRASIGPMLIPSYPGADGTSVQPLVDLVWAKEGEEFPFEAADEGFGPTLFSPGKWEFGLAGNIEGNRRRRATEGLLPRVRTTVEVGGFAQYQLTRDIRLRSEVRQGVNGHNGLIAVLSGDYIARDGDKWLFSIGPRATFSNGRYQRAYFGIGPADAAASGLQPYRIGGGLQAIGGTAGLVFQLTPRWGVYSFVKYDRLVSDAGRSPVVRRFGSRDQVSGGVALSYTFWWGR